MAPAVDLSYHHNDADDHSLSSNVFGVDLGEVDVWGDDETQRPRSSSVSTLSRRTSREKMKEALTIVDRKGVPPPPPPPVGSPPTPAHNSSRPPRKPIVLQKQDQQQQHQRHGSSRSLIRNSGSHRDILGMDNAGKSHGNGVLPPMTPRTRMRRLGMSSKVSAVEPPPPETPPPAKILSVAEKRRQRNEFLSSRTLEVEEEEDGTLFPPLSQRALEDSINVADFETSFQDHEKSFSTLDKEMIHSTPGRSSSSSSSSSFDLRNQRSSSSFSSLVAASLPNVSSISSPAAGGEDKERFGGEFLTSFGSKDVSSTRRPSSSKRLGEKRSKSTGSAPATDFFAPETTNEPKEGLQSNLRSFLGDDSAETSPNDQRISSDVKPLRRLASVGSTSVDTSHSSSMSSPRRGRVSRKLVQEHLGAASKTRDGSVPRAGRKIKFVKQSSDRIDQEHDDTRSRRSKSNQSTKSSKSKSSQASAISKKSRRSSSTSDCHSEVSSKSSQKLLSDVNPPRSRSSLDMVSACQPHAKRPSSSRSLLQCPPSPGEKTWGSQASAGKSSGSTPRSSTPRRKIQYKRTSSSSDTTAGLAKLSLEF